MKQPLNYIILASTWILLIILSYYFIDQHLTLYIHSHIDHGIIRSIAKVLTYLGRGTPYLVGLVLCFILFRFILHKKQLSLNVLYLFLCVAVSGIICDLVKVLLGRARPSLWFNHHIFGFTFFKEQYSYFSFPSGHVTTISSFALGLMLLVPKFRIPGILLIIAVAASRLILEWHYLSDVMGGALLGSATAIILGHAFKSKLRESSGLLGVNT